MWGISWIYFKYWKTCELSGPAPPSDPPHPANLPFRKFPVIQKRLTVSGNNLFINFSYHLSLLRKHFPACTHPLCTLLVIQCNVSKLCLEPTEGLLSSPCVVFHTTVEVNLGKRRWIQGWGGKFKKKEVNLGKGRWIQRIGGEFRKEEVNSGWSSPPF